MDRFMSEGLGWATCRFPSVGMSSSEMGMVTALTAPWCNAGECALPAASPHSTPHTPVGLCGLSVALGISRVSSLVCSQLPIQLG